MRIRGILYKKSMKANVAENQVHFELVVIKYVGIGTKRAFTYEFDTTLGAGSEFFGSLELGSVINIEVENWKIHEGEMT